MRANDAKEETNPSKAALSANVGFVEQPPFHLYIAPTDTPTLSDRIQWDLPLRPLANVVDLPVLPGARGPTRYVAGLVLDCRGGTFPLAAAGLAVSLDGVSPAPPSLNGLTQYFGSGNTVTSTATPNTGNFVIWISASGTGKDDLPAGYYDIDVDEPETKTKPKHRLITYRVGVPGDGQIAAILLPPTRANCHD